MHKRATWQTCGIKKKKITQHRDSNSYPLSSTGPQQEPIMVTIPLFPQLVFFPRPEWAIPDLHFLPGPYPLPPLLFLGAHSPDFPSFHGPGTRDDGDWGHSRKDALPPLVPSLWLSLQFLALSWFSLASDSPLFFKSKIKLNLLWDTNAWKEGTAKRYDKLLKV